MAKKMRHICNSLLLGLAVFMLLGLLSCSPDRHSQTLRPPVTPKVIVKETLHGMEIEDPYRWLEDQESPETRAWIQAQNQYTHAILDRLPAREYLTRRFTELIRIDEISIPIARNGRYFLSKHSADQELWVLCMRRGIDGPDEILVDPHPMSPDHTTSVYFLDVSKDGTLAAYGAQEGGEDEITITLLDVDSRTPLADRLPKGRYFGLSLLPDNSGFYYSLHTEKGSRIYFHKIGTDAVEDAEIFGQEYGPQQGILVDISEDGRYLLLTVVHGSAADKVELYIRNLDEKEPISPIVNDINARFFGQIAGDTLFLQTNWNAPCGRILAVDLNHPDRANWKEIIPQSTAVLETFSLAGSRLFLNYLDNVASCVKVFESNGQYVRDISFPAIGTVGRMAGRWESNEAFFYFTSFYIPPTIYQYDVAKGSQRIWSRLNVPVNTDYFDVEQVWYPSQDGTQIPMFIVHNKTFQRNGSNPVLLTGYGGFLATLTPYFSSTAVVWVENGGIFAMPNLRGGGEFGEAWHKAGMLENKQAVFDDFISAAEWLIEEGYTNPDKLAIAGGSNGGLLVGAALTQRPDLVKAVVCSYPLLDMLRYQKFMVGPLWISEYGSADNPEQFQYLRAYSPYHNIKAGTPYPSVLFLTGDADTRVAPLHARKMTAILQAQTGSDNPILLLYDTKLGHSGGTPASKEIEEAVDKMSYLFWQLTIQTKE